MRIVIGYCANTDATPTKPPNLHSASRASKNTIFYLNTASILTTCPHGKNAASAFTGKLCLNKALIPFQATETTRRIIQTNFDLLLRDDYRAFLRQISGIDAA